MGSRATPVTEVQTSKKWSAEIVGLDWKKMDTSILDEKWSPGEDLDPLE